MKNHHVSTSSYLVLALSAVIFAVSAEKVHDTDPSLQRHLRSNTNAFLSRNDRALTECSQECCDQLFEPSCDDEGSDNPFTQTPLAIQIILMAFLILMSAFFSGLTLGLMGLDKTGLEIVMEGDNAKYAAYAKRIYPLRKRGNLLLCTLLLGNVCVNSLLSILTADKFGGAIGLVSSTFLIVSERTGSFFNRSIYRIMLTYLIYR